MHPERLDVAAILRRLPLFLEVGPDQIRQLVDTTREKRLQKGEMLFHKGDLPKGFYVVVFGQIKHPQERGRLQSPNDAGVAENP